MKLILTLSTILLFFAICFSACEKIEKDTPPAIKKLIRKEKKNPAVVSEHEYNNENIYRLYEIGCRDCFVYYYDKNANLLWLSGGIEGKVEGTPLEGFYERSICKRIIWIDKATERYIKENNIIICK